MGELFEKYKGGLFWDTVYVYVCPDHALTFEKALT